MTSGILPVPAVQGGAVENLIDFYLEYNNQYQLHDITVYSIWNAAVKRHSALKTNANHYRYIKTEGFFSIINKIIYKKFHKKGYYNYTIEYYFEQAFKIIKKEKYDAIIVENRPGFVLKLMDRINTKYILHLHNDFLKPDTRQASNIFAGFNSIIGVSDFISNRVQIINPKQSKCQTVYNAIDSQRFYDAISLRRETFGLFERDFVIVYSGRLTKDKGILQLIQAINKLNGIQNLKLLIIGASAYGKDKQPTRFIQQLEKESEPIKDQVIFTGFIDYQQVPSYLKMADIAVIPSMWEEPFGLTVVEAMAAGLPLITTRSGGIPEICEGVATIVDRDNIVENLAASILNLYNNPEKCKQMSAASLERSKLFDKETYAKHFFAALESINSTDK